MADDSGVFRINPLQAWQREAILKAAQLMRDRLGNPPADARGARRARRAARSARPATADGAPAARNERGDPPDRAHRKQRTASAGAPRPGSAQGRPWPGTRHSGAAQGTNAGSAIDVTGSETETSDYTAHRPSHILGLCLNCILIGGFAPHASHFHGVHPESRSRHRSLCAVDGDQRHHRRHGQGRPGRAAARRHRHRRQHRHRRPARRRHERKRPLSRAAAVARHLPRGGGAPGLQEVRADRRLAARRPDGRDRRAA